MATMPTFAGATRWINSPPLGPSQLAGHVVLVNFWTLTCINWLRTTPYLRAWSEAYRDDGLVVVGVHTSLAGRNRGAHTTMSEKGKRAETGLGVRRSVAWPAST